jgi:ABC-type nitrate/sulfonate/bicarbonate transport system substrate-binding protein
MEGKTMERRGTLLVCGYIVAALLGLTVESPAQQKAKLRPLHIALANHSVTMTPIYVAKHMGIFESYGYDARVLVLEPRAGLTALLTGELDFYTGIGSTARAALRGLEVRVAFGCSQSPGFRSGGDERHYEH